MGVAVSLVREFCESVGWLDGCAGGYVGAWMGGKAGGWAGMCVWVGR